MWAKIEKRLSTLFPDHETSEVVDALQNVVREFQNHLSTEQKENLQNHYNFEQDDVALICYANSVVEENGSTQPLSVLHEFITKYNLPAYLKTIHILPFYPWDTDRGFSVMDYYEVNPEYGDWDDIKALGDVTQLMFDFVANHASIDNPLVQHALIERHLSKTDMRYNKYKDFKDFVLAYSEKEKPTEQELSELARPRPNPVLTQYHVIEEEGQNIRAVLGEPATTLKVGHSLLGTGWVWTTFSRPKRNDGSEDTRQVDLNFSNPYVLVESIKIILFYVLKGATFIRLDAIGYLWKKLGSTSLHEEETHELIAIMHDVLKTAARGIVTISEVNEPQDKSITYLGREDRAEADIMYQFSHFPLAIYAVLTGNGKPYSDWLQTLDPIQGRQFITILGSHDGLGLKPARGLLSESQLSELTDILVKKHNALPNFAMLPGGKKIVYEICATPWNLINNPASKESIKIQIKRYLAVAALGLMLKGIPAIYFNGLFGAENYQPQEGLDENRTVNRESFDISKLIQLLKNKDSHTSAVLQGVLHMLETRKSESAFDPLQWNTEVVETNKDAIIGVYVPAKDEKESLLCFVNISNSKQVISSPPSKTMKQVDVLSGKRFDFEEKIQFDPYDVLWLKSEQ